MNRTILWSLLLVSGFTVARAADDGPVQLFAEPRKDWVWDEDKRFDFLMERLASLEASLDAVNASIAKTTGKKSARQGEARRAEANNTLMDRKGGGPMAWNQFYGTNAEKFFYHPVDPSTTYRTDTLLRQMGSSQDDKIGSGVPASQSLPVHQRPPQWDYIYRANRDSRDRAEEEARKLEGKLEALLDRRFQLEQEQADLWARLAFRVIERLNIPRKPVLRFQLVGASTDPGDVQRAQALQAAAKFLSTALLVIDKAEKDQATALTSVREVVSSARESLDDELLAADAVAEEIPDKEMAIGKYVALAQLLDDTANNLGDSYEVAMEGDRADDEARKERFRGLLQRSLVEYSEILLGLDELASSMKADWKVRVDTKMKMPEIQVPWAEVDSRASRAAAEQPARKKAKEPVKPTTTKPVAYRFADEVEIRKDWSIQGDHWRIENGALRLQRNSSISSHKTYSGDFSLSVAYGGRVWVRACGEVFDFPQGGKVIVVERRGNIIVSRWDTSPPIQVQLKQEGAEQPTVIHVGQNDRGGIPAYIYQLQLAGRPTEEE